VRTEQQQPRVIFEDASLLAIDKPSGELRDAEVVGGLRRVHNPDPAASGLLVFAKTKRALDFLSGQFQAKSVEQGYHAFCVVLPEAAEIGGRAASSGEKVSPGGGKCAGFGGSDFRSGVPTEFAVDWWIGSDRETPGRMRAFRRNGGEPALSEFRVLERFGRFAFLQCRPRSNRRHQLRVHLAAAGLPVLNDSVYGLPEERLLLSDFKRGYKGAKGGEAERPMISQVALHASSLTLRHPDSGAPFTLPAPLPKAFEVALRNLRKFGRGGVSPLPFTLARQDEACKTSYLASRGPRNEIP